MPLSSNVTSLFPPCPLLPPSCMTFNSELLVRVQTRYRVEDHEIDSKVQGALHRWAAQPYGGGLLRSCSEA